MVKGISLLWLLLSGALSVAVGTALISSNRILGKALGIVVIVVTSALYAIAGFSLIP